jgi:site-specific recombinase XerD
MALCREAALRITTALQLTPSDVDFALNEIHTRTKGGASVNVPLTHNLRERLRWAVQATKGPQTPLSNAHRWHSKSGAPPDKQSALAALRVAQKRAGIEATWGFHDLRRTAARCLFEATHDIQKVQRLLSHRSLATTVWYLGNSTKVISPAEVETLTPRETRKEGTHGA